MTGLASDVLVFDFFMWQIFYLDAEEVDGFSGYESFMTYSIFILFIIFILGNDQIYLRKLWFIEYK